MKKISPEDCDSWVHWQESLPYEEKSLEERISKTRLIRILFADPSESFSVCAFREDGCILGGTRYFFFFLIIIIFLLFKISLFILIDTRVVKSVKTSASLTVTVPKEELTGENADLFKQLIEQTVVTASSFGFHIITCELFFFSFFFSFLFFFSSFLLFFFFLSSFLFLFFFFLI